jgi:hypothetical protein
VIQAQLRRIGVNLHIRLLEEGSLWSLLGSRLDARGEREPDFDALLTHREHGPESDEAYFLHSEWPVAARAGRLQGVVIDARGPFVSAQKWWIVQARKNR